MAEQVRKKKVVKKVGKKKVTTAVNVTDMSVADLFSMYLFVSNDANNRGFGATSSEAKAAVRDKHREIEEELYQRAYGYNPFEKFKVVFNGTKPEDVDLDRFAVIQSKVEEPKDETPDTFVVKKNKVQ